MANKYWVGGTGTWDASSTTHWSDTDGGASGAVAPTSADDVFFNANSSAANAAYTVTTVTASAVCNNMSMDGPGAGNKVTWSQTGGQFQIYGNMNMVGGSAGITRSINSFINFSGSGTLVVTSNGLTWANEFRMNGTGTLQFADTFNNGTSIITHNNGTLDTNGVTVTCGDIDLSQTTNTRTVTLGASAINMSGNWLMSATGTLTVTTNTATITMSGSGKNFNGYSKTWYNLVFTGAGTHGVFGANTFNNLTHTGTANVGDMLMLGGDTTVSGTFTSTGNSAGANRTLVAACTGTSSAQIYGTTRTITAAAVSLTNVDFMDITGAGAATWSGTSIGNAGGNSGITFTTPVTRYAVSFGSFSASIWSTTHGGSSGASTPICHDTAYLDNSSVGGTITVNVPRCCNLITDGSGGGTAYTGNLNMSGATHIFGNLTLTSSLGTLSNVNLIYAGRSSYGIMSGGKTFGSVTIAAPGGTYTHQDNVTCGNVVVSYGGWDTGGFTVTQGSGGASINSSNSNTRSVTLGNSTITNASSATPWEFTTTTNLTFNAGTSTLLFNSTNNSTLTFNGGGLTYNNISFQRAASTGEIDIVGANTFNNMEDRGIAAHTFRFPNTTTTAKNLFYRGSSGNLITFTDTTGSGASAATISVSGIVDLDWLSISHITAAGNSPFCAGGKSTLGTALTGVKGYGFPRDPQGVGNF